MKSSQHVSVASSSPAFQANLYQPEQLQPELASSSSSLSPFESVPTAQLRGSNSSTHSRYHLRRKAPSPSTADSTCPGENMDHHNRGLSNEECAGSSSSSGAGGDLFYFSSRSQQGDRIHCFGNAGDASSAVDVTAQQMDHEGRKESASSSRIQRHRKQDQEQRQAETLMGFDGARKEEEEREKMFGGASTALGIAASAMDHLMGARGVPASNDKGGAGEKQWKRYYGSEDIGGANLVMGCPSYTTKGVVNNHSNRKGPSGLGSNSLQRHVPDNEGENVPNCYHGADFMGGEPSCSRSSGVASVAGMPDAWIGGGAQSSTLHPMTPPTGVVSPLLPPTRKRARRSHSPLAASVASSSSADESPLPLLLMNEGATIGSYLTSTLLTHERAASSISGAVGGTHRGVGCNALRNGGHEPECLIELLPDELVIRVCSYLLEGDLCRVGRVAVRFYRIANDIELWYDDDVVSGAK